MAALCRQARRRLSSGILKKEENDRPVDYASKFTERGEAVLRVVPEAEQA